MNKFKIYSIDTYKGKTLQFIDENFEELVIDDVIEKIKIDNGYHMRIDPNKNYIFFGDCDGYNGTFNEFCNLLIKFLDKCYDIKIDKNDVSYTVNYSKNGSFHYSIPKIYASCKKIKEMHKNFILKSDIDNKYSVIDISIYSKHWFRLPNQKKEGKHNTEHIIKHGKLNDFIVEYIPPDSICVENKKYLFEQNMKKNIKNPNIDNDDLFQLAVEKNIKDLNINNNYLNIYDYRNILDHLSYSQVNNYYDWMKVGFALKNCSKENELLYEWIRWSKKSPKYQHGVCEPKWNTMTNQGQCTIGTILFMLKQDDINKFNQIIKILHYKKAIYKKNKINSTTIKF